MSELEDLVAWVKANLELIAEARAAATAAVESLNTGRTRLKWVMEGAENDYPAQAVGSLNTAYEDLDAFLAKLDGITRTFKEYLTRIAPGLADVSPGVSDADTGTSPAAACGASGAESTSTPKPASADGQSPLTVPLPAVGSNSVYEGWFRPDNIRNHGHPFNKKYEQWVRRRAGCGGQGGKEYLVKLRDKEVWFDALEVRVRDSKPITVLIDAKGRYEQFIDPDTGRWRKWWGDSETSGLGKLMERAAKQIEAAAGRPVEWHCAERRVALAFKRAFAGDRDVDGNRIKALYRPMPDQGE